MVFKRTIASFRIIYEYLSLKRAFMSIFFVKREFQDIFIEVKDMANRKIKIK